MALVETNINGLWVAKQTAKGTPATVGTKRLIQVAGDLNVARDDGSERWSDDSKFGSATDWVNTVQGAGQPGIEAQADTLAYLLWLFHGGEVATGTGSDVTHTFTPSNAGFFWSTWWKRVGSQQIQRQKFNDARIGQLVIEGSTANKAVRITPSLFVLDPGEVFATDPTPAISASPVFLYTEGVGAFTIDGIVIKGQSQFTLTLDEGLQPVYGDDTLVHDFARGRAQATLGVTVYADADGMARYNNYIYGTPTPSAGTKPQKAIPALGSYSFHLDKPSSTDDFTLTIPGVKWTVGDAVAPNPEGGAAEISLAGELRKSGGSALYTAAVHNADAAYTT